MSAMSTPTAPLSRQESSDHHHHHHHGSAAADPEIAMVEVSGLLAKPWERPMEEELPTNVSSLAQLEGLPDECLSKDDDSDLFPLQHIDEDGVRHRYHISPMFYSVIYILLVELLERFSFYGLTFTQTLYLTGEYNRDWNAGMTSVSASSYVSISVAIAYTSPFVGAVLADQVLGDYHTILLGAAGLYLPGLVLIALTTVPHLLVGRGGATFPVTALGTGLLFLWPFGTGIVKSLVNIFGAKQFHPLLQSSLIESYYVYFYMCINIGALAGILFIPVLAQSNVTVAYWIPVAMLSLGVMLFVRGTSRYVRNQPKRRHCFWNNNNNNKKKKNTAAHNNNKKQSLLMQTTPIIRPSSSVGMSSIFRICCLIIPFSIVYSQMATTFIVQGTVMKRAFGFIDAASMNCFDTISVLTNGYLIGGVLYPALAQRNVKLATTHKFAIGSGLAALAIAWALLVEHRVHSQYERFGAQVSVLWQIPSFALVGVGEIFAVSSAYEVAFTAAPPNQKGISSALNLFCIGGIPNILCIGLYHVGARWFTSARGTTSISNIEDYATAHVSMYFVTLLVICLVGIGINLLPSVRDWVESIEEEAADAIRTPSMTPRQRPTPRQRGRRAQEGVKGHDDDDDDEMTALLRRVKRHQNYMKEGSKPLLYKQGSFRAGIMLRMARREQQQKKKRKPPRYVKFSHGLTLYKKTAGGGGALEPVVRSDLDAKTERGIQALEKALEGKDDLLHDAKLSTSTT